MSKYVLVETISQFRQRYVIEVPDIIMMVSFPVQLHSGLKIQLLWKR